MGSGIEVGSVIAGTYEVTRLIGRGGMGEVWLAKHRRLPGKQVAIKVLHLGGQKLSPDQLARFRHEAEVATRIGHPNIVEVHDFNTLPNDAPYLVLEFLQGESLASRLRHPMDLAEAQRILRQVGSALQAAHAHGVVHRDLKPDNIFLVTEPMGTVVKVLDFGISKLVNSTTVQTQDAVLVGTPAYMSPEQAVGNNKDVGPQSDVFALGSIAYEMLAGRQAFSGDSIAQVVFRIAYEAHAPLASVRSGLPPGVCAAVEHALEKDRARRTPDVASFVLEFTGEPLPRLVLRPEEAPDAPSGVATPGMATPDSLMMGKTAAPTPGSPMPAPAPAVASAPGVAPNSRATLLTLVIAGLTLGLAGAGWWLKVNAGPVSSASPAGAREDRADPPERSGGASDAGAIALALEPPTAIDAGTADAGGSKRAVATRLTIPPVAERRQLAELERLVNSRNYSKASNEVDRAMRLELSEVGRSYAAMLSTQALCGYQSLDGALARFLDVTEPTHLAAARSFCAAVGVALSP